MTKFMDISTDEKFRDLLAPSLIERAESLELYVSDQTLMSRTFLGDVPIRRCRECDCLVYPEDFSGRLGHLIREHGYRMDGKRYDNQNQVVGE